MHVTITAENPSTEINISTTESVAAINTSTVSADFVEPSPNNLYAYTSVLSSAPSDIVSATAIANLENIGAAGEVQVNVGVVGHSPFQSELQGFKNVYKEFNSSASSFSHGNLCYFVEDDTYSVDYNTRLEPVSINNNLYAQSTIYIFLAYSNNNLYVMHKGYFDFADTSTDILNWSAGKTLYIDTNNKLNTIPSYGSGDYVRSVGFCVPNKENKKRIWFESDSTFVKKS